MYENADSYVVHRCLLLGINTSTTTTRRAVARQPGCLDSVNFEQMEEMIYDR